MTNDAHEGLANATTRDDAAHALALGWNKRLATELIEKKYDMTSLQRARHKRSLWRLAVWLFFYAAYFESGAL